jgi:hypothetical protein
MPGQRYPGDAADQPGRAHLLPSFRIHETNCI